MNLIKEGKILIIVFLLSIAGSSCGTASDAEVLASGLIEALEINVSPELSGRVMEIMVSESDSVKQGDVLLRLDGSLLEAQKEAAEAALVSAQASLRSVEIGLQAAQAQYDLTLAAALAHETPLRLAAWFESPPLEFDQPDWYFNKDELIAAVEADLADSREQLSDAMSALEDMETRLGGAAFLQAESDLARALVAYRHAREVLDNAGLALEGRLLRQQAQADFDLAKESLKQAQLAYDDSLTTDAAQEILKARAGVVVARERYDTSRDSLRELQTGAQSPEVVIAGQVVEQAQALVDQVIAEIDQVKANQNLLEIQMEKLALLAPMDGIILHLSIHAGEVIQAGMTALTLADLENLEVTVYVPEDRYGEISLGDQATLQIDSFPGQTFLAVVTRIADQAEFTPRNVQTREERQTTVYAVILAVDNPDGKLKPGMPVDVSFAP